MSASTLTLLAIELSTPHGSVAVVADGEVVFECSFESKRSHNAQLFEPLAEALKVAGSALGGVVVGTGPGSYTGVRIGIAAAQGVGLSRSVPVMGMSSLLAATDADEFVVIGDARRQQFYTATVRQGELGLPIEVFPNEEWEERKAALSGGCPWLCCDSVVPLAAAGAEVALAQPTAGRLGLRAWGAMDWASPAVSDGGLEPLYLQDAFITLPKAK